MAQFIYARTSKLSSLFGTAAKLGYEFAHVRPDNMLVFGADPFRPTHFVDFASEKIRPITSSGETPEPPAPRARRASRRSGEYYIEIMGETIECLSLKEIVSEGLKALERHRPGTLNELSKIKPRSKRIVARDPNQLFKNPELVKKYAEKLLIGWWFGTNNSTHETLTWLRRGAEIAGLEWGKDIQTSVG